MPVFKTLISTSLMPCFGSGTSSSQMPSPAFDLTNAFMPLPDFIIAQNQPGLREEVVTDFFAAVLYYPPIPQRKNAILSIIRVENTISALASGDEALL